MQVLVLILLASLIFNVYLLIQKKAIFKSSSKQLRENVLPAWFALNKNDKIKIIERIFYHLRTKEILDSMTFEKLKEMEDEKLDGVFTSLVESYTEDKTENATIIWAATWLTSEVSYRLNKSIQKEKLSEGAESLNNLGDDTYNLISSDLPMDLITKSTHDVHLQALIRLLT